MVTILWLAIILQPTKLGNERTTHQLICCPSAGFSSMVGRRTRPPFWKPFHTQKLFIVRGSWYIVSYKMEVWTSKSWDMTGDQMAGKSEIIMGQTALWNSPLLCWWWIAWMWSSHSCNLFKDLYPPIFGHEIHLGQAIQVALSTFMPCCPPLRVFTKTTTGFRSTSANFSWFTW